MKILAVKIQTKEQFEAVVAYNLFKGFKMIGGVKIAFNPLYDVVETGANFRVYTSKSPYSWTNKIVSFPVFKQLNSIMN